MLRVFVVSADLYSTYLAFCEEQTLIHSRYLGVSDSRLQEIIVQEDSVLQELIATINSGWPNKFTEVRIILKHITVVIS